jgi:hypothetical protein
MKLNKLFFYAVTCAVLTGCATSQQKDSDSVSVLSVPANEMKVYQKYGINTVGDWKAAVLEMKTTGYISNKDTSHTVLFQYLEDRETAKKMSGMTALKVRQQREEQQSLNSRETQAATPNSAQPSRNKNFLIGTCTTRFKGGCDVRAVESGSWPMQPELFTYWSPSGSEIKIVQRKNKAPHYYPIPPVKVPVSYKVISDREIEVTEDTKGCWVVARYKKINDRQIQKNQISMSGSDCRKGQRIAFDQLKKSGPEVLEHTK